MSLRRVVSLVALPVLAAACMGSNDRSIAVDDLSQTVLQPGDLSDDFFRFDEGRLITADSPRGEQGWKARYRRRGTPQTRGPLVVESRVDRFEDAGAAEGGLEELRTELSAGGAAEAEAPDLGDEAVAARLRQPGVTPVDYFTIAWREANLVAAVSVNGFARRVAFADAVELARRQQRRIERVAEPPG